MRNRSTKKAIGLGLLAIILASVLVYAITGRKFYVEVRLPDGSTVRGAEVCISDVSAPCKPASTTNSDGRAHLTRKRASKGGWHSLIVTYTDAQGQRYMGQKSGSHPTFPVYITMTRRD